MTKIIKQNSLPIFILGCWFIYAFFMNNLTDLIPHFITMGTSLIIKILEFTVYRGSLLLTYTVIYFILACMSYTMLFYSKQAQDYTLTTRNKIVIGAIFFVLNIYIFIKADIFFLIYLLLHALSLIVVYSAFKVGNLLLQKN